jgi:hypothetical protein
MEDLKAKRKNELLRLLWREHGIWLEDGPPPINLYPERANHNDLSEKLHKDGDVEAMSAPNELGGDSGGGIGDDSVIIDNMSTFWKNTSPDFYQLMQRVRRQGGTDE